MTTRFESHANPLYRHIRVTTKHSYAIHHKYLWVCAGTPPNAARDFLNLPDDGGCGAEYGRHSKSIDTAKHRCGKCRGVLVMVRPLPRKVDPGKGLLKKRRDPLGKLNGMMEGMGIEED